VRGDRESKGNHWKFSKELRGSPKDLCPRFCFEEKPNWNKKENKIKKIRVQKTKAKKERKQFKRKLMEENLNQFKKEEEWWES